jgi:hypothetical protein
LSAGNFPAECVFTAVFGNGDRISGRTDEGWESIDSSNANCSFDIHCNARARFGNLAFMFVAVGVSIGFFALLYEKTLTETTVILLRDALATLQVPVSHVAMNGLVDNIRTVMESCEWHADEARSQNIGCCLINTIVIVLPYNLALAPAFPLFHCHHCG